MARVEPCDAIPVSPAPSARERCYSTGQGPFWELPRVWTMRDLRESSGLALRELGRRCGVASPTLSLIERGRLVPTAAEIAAIQFGLDLEDGSLSLRLLVVKEDV